MVRLHLRIRFSEETKLNIQQVGLVVRFSLIVFFFTRIESTYFDSYIRMGIRPRSCEISDVALSVEVFLSFSFWALLG